ncbi:hypothetical protein BGZ70_002893 [Mortierella alpina]|uniref:Uncharacterized protein n=1 Tax=Mortierella alpina TaxID=64518 RepID=A0A9P6IT99_MORAP|nr:hypothetical protein BGZ70_002893 [Mortierella alpina]
MSPLCSITLVLLTVLAGSVIPQHDAQAGLAHAYQDSAHYFLPANIYEKLPPGVQPPLERGSLPPQPAIVLNSNGVSPDPDSPPTIDITNPLLNSVYVPGSSLFMTWANNGIRFPENWQPPQSILDLITNDPNFSHSPLLTKDDMRNLAQMKLEELKRAQLATLLKDSPIFLHSLRLVSWPLKEQKPSPATATTMTTTTTTLTDSATFSPDILNNPGYNLVNVSKVTLLGGAGGQMTWTIPEDWSYEGEFEIRIPAVGSGTGGSDASSHSNSAAADPDLALRYAKSRPFWILRDSAARTDAPQYTLPSMDRQQQALVSDMLESAHRLWQEREARRHRDMGIFLGVAAMLLALVVVGLGALVAVYRRKWVKDQQYRHQQRSFGTSSDSGHGNTLSTMTSTTTATTATTNSGESGTMTVGSSLYDTDSVVRTASSSYSQYTSSSLNTFARRALESDQEKLIGYYPYHHEHYPLNIALGDEDAHSPVDLNLSEVTLDGAEFSQSGAVAAAEGSELSEKRVEPELAEMTDRLVSPAESSRTVLPPYKTSDSTSTLTAKEQYPEDTQAKE